MSQSLSSWWWRLPLQEGVISWCNGENVGQYLGSIIIQDLRSILCHQLGPADHWYHRPLPLLLAQALDLLVGGFVWTQHVDLCSKKHLYFPWIWLSIFSQFPVVNFTGCWMASYFPVKLPRKENHFWHSLHLKLKREIFKGLLFPLEIGYTHLVVTQICANRSSFWQNKGFVLHVCVASSDNRSWSLHLFTESTSGWKWTTSPTINSSECPPPWSCTSKLSNWSKSFSAKSTQNTPKLIHILFLLILSWLPLTKVENCSVPNSPPLNIPTS